MKKEFTEKDVRYIYNFVHLGLNGSFYHYPPDSSALLDLIIKRIRKKNQKNDFVSNDDNKQ